MKQTRGHSIPFLEEPESRAGKPLYLLLYRRIREGILQGALAPGTRLPSSRALASEEGVSRNTVETAFRQLQVEGFLVRKVGSGTYVADDLPERLLRPRPARRGTGGQRAVDGVDGADRVDGVAASDASIGPRTMRLLSERGRLVGKVEGEYSLPAGLCFAPCLPGREALPTDTWNRIAARHARRSSRSPLAPAPAGLPELREAVAGYLHLSRGVRCSADRIVILNSTQQAIHLASRLLLDPGDQVWFEDPGYSFARHALLGMRARLFPTPVDAMGVDVELGVEQAPEARMAYVTPSHQYPMGVTLSLSRRLELLEWAADAEAWIFEDDYDSELRHQGRPLVSVQGIDQRERVLYAGTFNKILFPALRLAYLVLPPRLVGPFVKAKELTDGFTSPLLQAVLADFIGDGHFSVHVRRVRELYRKRRDRFMAVAEEAFPETVSIGPAEAGLHLTLRLPPDTDDVALSRHARSLGLAVPALSDHSIDSRVRGLLIHYGYSPLRHIEEGVRTLGRLLHDSV